MRDARLSASAGERIEAERKRYERIWAGEPYREEDIFPTRDDFVSLYVLVRKQIRSGISEMSQRALLSKLSYAKIGYVKLKLMIRIFQELNLLGIEEIEDDFYRFRLHTFDTKIDLEKSNLLRRLRSQRRTTE